MDGIATIPELAMSYTTAVILHDRPIQMSTTKHIPRTRCFSALDIVTIIVTDSSCLRYKGELPPPSLTNIIVLRTVSSSPTSLTYCDHNDVYEDHLRSLSCNSRPRCSRGSAPWGGLWYVLLEPMLAWRKVDWPKLVGLVHPDIITTPIDANIITPTFIDANVITPTPIDASVITPTPIDVNVITPTPLDANVITPTGVDMAG